jgi:hypothetical protein
VHGLGNASVDNKYHKKLPKITQHEQGHPHCTVACIEGHVVAKAVETHWSCAFSEAHAMKVIISSLVCGFVFHNFCVL